MTQETIKDHVKRLLEAKKAKAAADEAIKKETKYLWALIDSGDIARSQCKELYGVTPIETSVTMIFNSKAFQAEFPNVYEEYKTFEKAGSRSFR